ncbi:cache domain-containing sensor histidine kinase [Paenibacillus hamazuiensis]|uniref:cache domain-containing sensor histidine kinase n=1 Tax=Paenibacillus hamazuiensis TaxID=2936508 RepID=UPI00200C28D8|nr:sensor histidine kinase [Paenibacillus hamazuiensis]
MYRKLFVKNLLIFTVPLLIPLILLGTLTQYITNKYVKTSFTKSNLAVLGQVQNNVETILDEINSLYLHYGVTYDVKYDLTEALNSKQISSYQSRRFLSVSSSYLYTESTAKPYIHSIYVYFDNPYGQFLSSGGGIVQLDQFYDKDWYESFQNNPSDKTVRVESRSIRNSSAGKPAEVLSLYQNIYSSGNEQPIGVIVLNVDKSYFAKALDKIDTHRKQEFFILDQDNNLLFQAISADSKKTGTLLSKINDEGFYSTVTVNKRSFVVSHINSSRSGWKYISVIPEKRLYRTPHELTRLTVLLGLLSLLLGFAITFVFMRRNHARVQELISIVRAAEKDEYPQAAQVPFQDDEYGYIAHNVIKSFITQHQLKLMLSEKKLRLQQAQYLALTSQMNPHFLFNTLSTIYWKVVALTGGPNEVNRMIENLSNILKYALDLPGKTVPMEKEISQTRSYIEIQKVRYQDKFDVLWKVPPEIHPLPVIKMLLQPLIENSLYHGIKEKAGPGFIKVKIAKRHSMIHITIVDNGIGMRTSRLQEVKKLLELGEFPSGHVGLSNVYNRLKLMYDSRFSIRLWSKINWGTVIEIAYPIE